MEPAVRWAALVLVASAVLFVFHEPAPRDVGRASDVVGPPASRGVGELDDAPLVAAPHDASRARSVVADPEPLDGEAARDVSVGWPCASAGPVRLVTDGSPVDGGVPLALDVPDGAPSVAIPAPVAVGATFGPRGTGSAWRARLVDAPDGERLELEPLNRVRVAVVDAVTGRPVGRPRLTLASRMGPSTRLIDVDRTPEAPGGRVELGGWPISPSATHVQLLVTADERETWRSDWIPTAGVGFALDAGLVALAPPPRWSGRVVSSTAPGGVVGALVHAVPAGDGGTLSWGEGRWRLPASWAGSPFVETDGDGAFDLELPSDGRLRLVVLAAGAPPWWSEACDVAVHPARVWHVELVEPGAVELRVESDAESTFVARLARDGGELRVERTVGLVGGGVARFVGLAAGTHGLALRRHVRGPLYEDLVDESVDVAPGSTVERVWHDAVVGGRTVWGRVLGLSGDGLVAALVDAETLERVAPSVPVDVDGGFALRTSHAAPAFASIFGRGPDGSTVVALAPVGLDVPGAPPTVTFEPLATRLVVTSDGGAAAVALTPRTGRPDVDRVAGAVLGRVPLSDGRVVLDGLPPGRYEVAVADGASVVVDVARGRPAECRVE